MASSHPSQRRYIMEYEGIKNYLTEGIQDAIDAGDKSLEEDWVNHEVRPCEQCSGSGRDWAEGVPCIACDGTGVDCEIKYGVSSGQMFIDIVQNGMEPILQVCKEHREREGKGWLKDDAMGLQAFMIPFSARLDLLSMGYPVIEWEQAGDMRSYARVVRKHYPQFMTTNVVI